MALNSGEAYTLEMCSSKAYENGSVHTCSSRNKNRDYRASSPGLEGTVVSRLDGFDRDVLVSTERGDDRGVVGKGDFVLRVGRVKTLEKGDGGVEDHSALTASLGVDAELMGVDDVGFHARDVGGRGASQVDLAKE